MATSLYTANGEYIKHIPQVLTVGQLIEALQKLPPALPLSDRNRKLVWVNVGGSHIGCAEHLCIESTDDWDDDDDE